MSEEQTAYSSNDSRKRYLENHNRKGTDCYVCLSPVSGTASVCESDGHSRHADFVRECVRREAPPEVSTPQATSPAHVEFVSIISRLVADRECEACWRDGDEPNPDCKEHDPFDMESDDAVEILNALIRQAREIAGAPKTFTRWRQSIHDQVAGLSSGEGVDFGFCYIERDADFDSASQYSIFNTSPAGLPVHGSLKQTVARAIEIAEQPDGESVPVAVHPPAREVTARNVALRLSNEWHHLLVDVDGKLFRVTAICTSDQEANQHCLQSPSDAVIDEVMDCGSYRLIIVAEKKTSNHLRGKNKEGR